MRIQKLLIYLIVVSVACFALAACGDSDETVYDGIDLTPNTDPVLLDLQEAGSTGFGQLIGLQDEQNYDQIVVTSVKSVYSLKDDTKFSCTIENRNVGHGFYVYGVVYIDKFIDGEWIRQTHIQAKKTEEITQWKYIGIENNSDGINSSSDGVKIEDIYPSVTAGKYRFVVFTPIGCEYAEFEVVE